MVKLGTLEPQHFRLKESLPMIVEREGRRYIARIPEADISACGQTRQEAMWKAGVAAAIRYDELERAKDSLPDTENEHVLTWLRQYFGQRKSLLNTTLELDDPRAIPYFLVDQPMTVQALREGLKLTSAPEWPQLVVTVLRKARPDDALYLVGLETIIDHLDELAEHLGPKREKFWRWLVNVRRRYQTQEMPGMDELLGGREQPSLDRHRRESPEPFKFVRPAERIGRLLTILRVATRLEREEVAAACGLQTESFLRYEKGELVPGLNVIQKMLEAQELPLEALELAGDFVEAVEGARDAERERKAGSAG